MTMIIQFVKQRVRPKCTHIFYCRQYNQDLRTQFAEFVDDSVVNASINSLIYLVNCSYMSFFKTNSLNRP